jgi:hypothetical protein
VEHERLFPLRNGVRVFFFELDEHPRPGVGSETEEDR